MKTTKGFLFLCVTANLFGLAPAPVPRCSPFIIINKLAESNNLMSDSNPYFPVPPCEYGGWMEALNHGDLQSMFVLAEPAKIPLHNFYEFIWFLRTGGPRLLRMLTGREDFVLDNKILREGYKHHTPYARSQQFGQYTKRNPAIIDDNNLYKKVVGKNIRVLFSQGKDRQINKHYTFQGNLRNGIHGQGNGHGHHGSHHSHGGGHGGFAYSAEPQHYPAPGVGGVSQTPIDGFHAHNAAFSSLAPGGGGGSGGVHHTGFSSSSGPSTGFTFTGSSGGTGYGSIPSGLRTAGNTHSANQVSQFPASQPSGGNFVQSGGYQNSLGPTHDGFGNTGSSLSTGLPHVVFPENNHISFPADFPTRGQVTNHIITSNNGFQQSSTYNVVPVASSGSNAGFYNPSRPKKEVNDNNSVSTQIKLVHDEFFLPSTWPKQILKRNSATAEGVTTKAFQKSVFSHTLGPELVAAVDSNSLVLGQAQPAAQLPQSLRNDDDSNDQELQTNGSYQPGWHAPHEASSSYPSSRESPVGHQRPSGAALPHLTGPTKGHTRRPRPQTLRKGRSWKSKQSSLSSRMKRLKENLSLKNLVDRFRSLFYQTTTKKRRGINI